MGCGGNATCVSRSHPEVWLTSVTAKLAEVQIASLSTLRQEMLLRFLSLSLRTRVCLASGNTKAVSRKFTVNKHV